MKSLDTNIIVRLLIGDDDRQVALARQVIAAPCLVLPGVVLEAMWAVGSLTDWSRAQIAANFADLMTVSELLFADEGAVRWAFERFAEGADFPDMLHLALSAAADSFVTFDPEVARYADASVVAVETLR